MFNSLQRKRSGYLLKHYFCSKINLDNYIFSLMANNKTNILNNILDQYDHKTSKLTIYLKSTVKK